MKHYNDSQPGRNHIRQSLSDLKQVPTAHNAGTKMIFAGASPTPVIIKQVEVGRLQPGEVIEKHLHPDLDEHYFVLSGYI